MADHGAQLSHQCVKLRDKKLILTNNVKRPRIRGCWLKTNKTFKFSRLMKGKIKHCKNLLSSLCYVIRCRNCQISCLHSNWFRWLKAWDNHFTIKLFGNQIQCVPGLCVSSLTDFWTFFSNRPFRHQNLNSEH